MATGRTNSVISLGKEEQTKTITITSNGKSTVTPDEGKVFSKVDITTNIPIPETQTKSVNITTNGTTTITPDSGKVLSSVKVTTNISGNNTLKTLLDTTKSTRSLFAGYQGASIDNLIQYDDTENVINTYAMFSSCSNLTTIPLLNTSKVTEMNQMFYMCINLTTIPLLDTSQVTILDNLFYRCQKLTSIPALNVSNTTSMGNTFRYCSALEEIHMTGMKVSFDISASTKFTETALVEILNNLATVTESQTLTMGETNLAKLTDDDKKIATDKGWTLA